MTIDGHDIPVVERRTCKRLILHAQEGRLYLSVPPGTPEQEIRNFLTRHRDWIAQHAGGAPVRPAAPAGMRPQMMRLGAYEVVVTPRSNCRRMILHARKGEGTLTLSVPMGTTEQAAREFLLRNEGWIRANGRPAQAWTPCLAPGEVHPVMGQMVVLGRAGVPGGAAFERQRQARLEAFVGQILPQWARRMGVQPRSVRFRQMKSRWGSCQVRTHDITLNTNLAKMPPECIEYVVVHELCHLIVPDHSPAFHAAMTRFLPDWEARKRALNQFDTTPRPCA